MSAICTNPLHEHLGAYANYKYWFSMSFQKEFCTNAKQHDTNKCKIENKDHNAAYYYSFFQIESQFTNYRQTIL